ncbi:MAG: hypothetical protein ACYDG6_04405 [Thermincolia bacterium]
MLKVKRFALLFTLITLLTLVSGCGITEKVQTLKDDVINVTMDQISVQLENSLNEQFPDIVANNPELVNSNGEVNWEAFKGSELANYVFYSLGDHEFRAALSGDGLFKIERINNATNESFSYAEFQVDMANGEFKVNAK